MKTASNIFNSEELNASFLMLLTLNPNVAPCNTSVAVTVKLILPLLDEYLRILNSIIDAKTFVAFTLGKYQFLTKNTECQAQNTDNIFIYLYQALVYELNSLLTDIVENCGIDKVLNPGTNLPVFYLEPVSIGSSNEHESYNVLCVDFGNGQEDKEIHTFTDFQLAMIEIYKILEVN